jgi:hypothetical protein
MGGCSIRLPFLFFYGLGCMDQRSKNFLCGLLIFFWKELILVQAPPIDALYKVSLCPPFAQHDLIKFIKLVNCTIMGSK